MVLHLRPSYKAGVIYTILGITFFYDAHIDVQGVPKALFSSEKIFGFRYCSTFVCL